MLGDYGAAGALESEAALGRRYGVSRVTIRRALEELREEGLILSRKGSGWFVARDPVREVLGVLPSASAALSASGVELSRQVIEFGFTLPPPPVAAALRIDEDVQSLRARRLHFADGVPYDLISTWLPPHVAGSVSRDDLEQLGAWETLRSVGIEPTRTMHSITAGAAVPEHAELLGLPAGAPLLLLRRLALTEDDQPVALSHHRYAARHIRIDIEFRGESSTTAAEPPGLQLIPGGEVAV